LWWSLSPSGWGPVGSWPGAHPDEPAAPAVAQDATGLNALQIVIRSEIAERPATGSTALNPLQLVIRGEVAERYADGSAGLNPLQIVIRGEVADRYEVSEPIR
jgi:hypothetical protein